MSLEPSLILSLLNLRNYLQSTSVTNTKLNKQTVKNLLITVIRNTKRILQEYELPNASLNMFDLITNLMTFIDDRTSAVYQLVAGTEEMIRRELCEWTALIRDEKGGGWPKLPPLPAD